MVHSYDGILCVCESLSHVRLFAIPWIITAHQPPLSVEFSMQEYWSGLPFPSLGDLPDPGIEPTSPALQADSLPLSHQGSPHITFEYKRLITYRCLDTSPKD